jgi:predicted GNAT family acetyltransferase
MNSSLDTSVLDNIVWHALIGPLRRFAQRNGDAACFEPDVTPFGAVRDVSSESAWSDLGDLVGHNGRTCLFATTVPRRNGWFEEARYPCFQLVAGDLRPVPSTELVELGPDDVPEMIELVKLTEPGPFLDRTVELGAYLGHRARGALVAMAGERLRCDGFTEVSAVCTHPDHRGRGLGAALTAAVSERIRARGDEAFLHVVTDNPALRVYEALGYAIRCEAAAVILRRD